MTFLHLSLMVIVVEHVVLFPAKLHTTTKLFYCLVAFSPMVNISHRLVSFQSSLLPNWSSTSSLLHTGLQPHHFCPTGLQHFVISAQLVFNFVTSAQLVFNTSSLLPNWSSIPLFTHWLSICHLTGFFATQN